MTKLAREGRLRERRAAKAARKDARKNAPPEDIFGPANGLEVDEAEIVEGDAEEAVAAAVGTALTDA